MSGEEFFTHLQAIINARDYQNLSPFFEQYELTVTFFIVVLHCPPGVLRVPLIFPTC
jgi:hypothetical protein